jgi:hypothetical protein
MICSMILGNLYDCFTTAEVSAEPKAPPFVDRPLDFELSVVRIQTIETGEESGYKNSMTFIFSDRAKRYRRSSLMRLLLP